MMDSQTLFNLVGSAAIAAGGWFSRQLWDSVQALKSDIHQIEVDLPTNYVSKADLDKRMDHIEEMFQRIYDKLDAKVDK